MNILLLPFKLIAALLGLFGTGLKWLFYIAVILVCLVFLLPFIGGGMIVGNL